MGFEKLAEEAAGAFAADKALEAADPDAGFLAKAAAGVAGFVGAGKLGDMLSGQSASDQNEAGADAQDPQDGQDAQGDGNTQ
ncbi:MAG: hypothetical protein JSR96_07355 [Proteobacteria bacterium]|nr:hypothetical protein [Pseudomonadota bacterium]